MAAGPTSGVRTRHALTAVAGVCTATSLLLGAGITDATAAGATFGHLSTSSVLTALQTPASLPKGVKLLGKVEIAPAKPATPCGTAKPTVSLANANEVAAIYTDGKTAKPTASTSVWSAYDAVFVTAKLALAAATALAKAEAACPAKVTDAGVSLTRTVAAPDTAEKGLWKGFRGVSHLTQGKESVRVWTTWFVRGNVLLAVTEAAPVTTVKAQRTQDALRKSFINTTLAKLDKAAA